MGPCRGVDLGKAGSCRSGVIRALGLHESGQHLHVRLERRKAKVACTLPFPRNEGTSRIVLLLLVS